jgi:RHS repeat-associated protein
LTGCLIYSSVQRFEWDDENQLTAVHTKRKGITQTVRFDYDALGRRITKHDRFGATRFVWEGMRLIEERRGGQTITYVYEPGSYVPLARLDATGTVIPPDNQEPSSPQQETGLDTKHQAASENPPKTNIYYFHNAPSGLPEELSDEGGNIRWRAAYKAWGSTLSERWETVDLAGYPVTTNQVEPEAIEQNLRFQGQYLDRDTGLHYNTFRYYDPDIGRFISPDPIGLMGGMNLQAYAPNPVSWVDPLGWCAQPANAQKKGGRTPIFVDNNVLVAAERGNTTALGEIRSGQTFITPNQYREFINPDAIPSHQLKSRKALLRAEGIQTYGGKKAASAAAGSNFRNVFEGTVGTHGRADAALGAFARETGFEAVTFEKRITNFYNLTHPKLQVPIRRI